MKKKSSGLLIIAIFAISMFAGIQCVSAQQQCPIEMGPSPTFGRDDYASIISQYSLSGTFYGISKLQARLLRYVWVQWDNGYSMSSSTDDYLWIDTHDWYPSGTYDNFNWPAQFINTLTVENLEYGLNGGSPGTFENARWEVRYKIEWKWAVLPWDDPYLIGTTGTAESVHTELNFYGKSIEFAGLLEGTYAEIWDENNILGPADNNFAAGYGYQTGDTAIFDIEMNYWIRLPNASPETPYDLNIRQFTWDYYEPYVALIIGN